MTLLETTADSYRLDVGTYPRVTSILSLVRTDLREIPADVLAHAAQRGQAVHRACYLLAGGIDRHGKASGLAWDSLGDEVRPYVEAFQDFTHHTRCRFLAQEQLVVSRRYGYAGTMDFLCELGGVRSVLDVKTGEPHPAHRLQLAAYREAWMEGMRSRGAVDRLVLYLKPDGRYRLVNCEESGSGGADFRVFTALLQVWRWQRNGGNGR